MNIIEKPSPNFTVLRHSYKPEAIVIHIMEGTLAGTDAWFANPQSKVSAHYGIGLNGEVHRYVQEVNTAWHAGRVNAPTWTKIKPGAGGYVNPNFYTLGIEHEGNAGSVWSDSMYNTSSQLIALLAGTWNIPIDSDHVIGHREIYSLKTCPGFKVDLDKLISMARNTGQQPGSRWRKVMISGKAITTKSLNIRPYPNTGTAPLRTEPAGKTLEYVGYTDEGEKIYGNGTWYMISEGQWFWSGGVE